MKAEVQYAKTALPYRRRQTAYWDSHTPEEIASDLIQKVNNPRRKNKIKYIRVGECGDFRDQDDVDKLIKIALMMKLWTQVKIYAFTARRDLDFEELPQNLIINGSGFMLDNSFTVIEKGAEVPKGAFLCGGDCRECDLCKYKRGLDIRVEVH